MRHFLSMAIVLASIWLLLSGHYTVLVLTLGAASCGLVLVVAARMDLIDYETQPLHLLGELPRYWVWLLGQILRANFDIARRVVRRRPLIEPGMVTIPLTEKTELGQTIFANSLTLTPGTVSVTLVSGTVEVHGLTKASAQAVAGGEMQRRVVAMERAVTGESEGS